MRRRLAPMASHANGPIRALPPHNAARKNCLRPLQLLAKYWEQPDSQEKRCDTLSHCKCMEQFVRDNSEPSRESARQVRARDCRAGERVEMSHYGTFW